MYFRNKNIYVLEELKLYTMWAHDVTFWRLWYKQYTVYSVHKV